MASRNGVNPVAHVVAKFGGVPTLADRLAVYPSTIYRWQRNGFFPATLRGVPLAPWLVELAKNRRIPLTRSDVLLGK